MSFLSDFIKFRSISIENSPRKSIISKKEQKIEGPEDEHKYIVTEINDQQFIRDDNEIIFETALDVQVEQQNSENEPLSNQQAQQEDLLEESFINRIKELDDLNEIHKQLSQVCSNSGAEEPECNLKQCNNDLENIFRMHQEIEIDRQQQRSEMDAKNSNDLNFLRGITLNLSENDD